VFQHPQVWRFGRDERMENTRLETNQRQHHEPVKKKRQGRTANPKNFKIGRLKMTSTMRRFSWESSSCPDI